MELHYCVPVWGRRYVELLTDVSMPSLLAEGNLPTLGRSCTVRFRIFTRSEDVPLLRSSAIWPAFTACVPTEIVTCDQVDLSETYAGMSNLLREAIRQAGAAGAAFVPQASDTFWSDGSFATVGRLLQAGKKLILCGGVRVTAESFIPAVRQRHQRPDGVLAAPARQLVDLAVQHLHPSMGAYLAGNGLRPRDPSLWLRPCTSRSFVQNIVHAIPLAIVGTGYDARFSGTVDRGFIETLGLGEHEVAIVDSSDDLLLLDIARARRFLGAAGLDPASDAVVTGRWLFDQGEAHGLYGGRFYAHPVRFLGTDADRPEAVRALAHGVRQARRDVVAGLVVAEALVAARALRERGWREVGGILARFALEGRLTLPIARLRPYTACLPVAPDALEAALGRLGNHVVPRVLSGDGPGASARPSPNSCFPPSLHVLDGPVETGLGRIYLVAPGPEGTAGG